MEFLSEIFRAIAANESVLSGIAAAIVILGVLIAAIRQLLGRSARGSGPSEVERRAIEPVSAEPATVALHTDSPSIAVMPFANLSGEPEQDFLGDGLTEDIIFGLSRVKQLFVIARNTCFTYKGKTPDALAVSRELGVRYVLEGSVRKAGDRIRVTAQLVDAQTRTPKWSERFDRKVEEILEVDDEVTEAIVAALLPALRRAEAEQAHRASPEDLTAWSLANRAWVTIQNDLGDSEAARDAIQACGAALALDPDYAFAHAVLGHARSLLLDSQSTDAKDLIALSLASIHTALELEPNDPVVRHCHAAVLANVGQTDDSTRAWQRAVDLDPNNAGARAGLGISMIFKGLPEEGLELIDGALRRSPADPLQYHWLGNRSLGLLSIGQVTESIESARKSLDRKPSRLAYAVLATALAHEDRLEEAGEAYASLDERFDGLVAVDFARMAGKLSPDAEWGKIVERNLLRAAEAAQARPNPTETTRAPNSVRPRSQPD